jgi:hypothetical protein
MTLTLAQKSRQSKARIRKRGLAASGHVYGDLARLARVSYSMAYKWMNGERESAEVDRAFKTLTNGGAS